MEQIFFKKSHGIGKIFAVVAVALTLAVAAAYVLVQQNMRMNANDPQVEITEGIVEALSQGQDPQAFSSLNPTDLTKSLSPFVIVYDGEGKAISGTAELDGQIPTPPKGVFDAAKAKGQNRLSWEPKEKVRVAAVVTPYSAVASDASSSPSSGYVLVGRSLREVESRIQTLTKLIAVAWAASLLICLLVINLVFAKKEEHSQANTHA